MGRGDHVKGTKCSSFVAEWPSVSLCRGGEPEKIPATASVNVFVPCEVSEREGEKKKGIITSFCELEEWERGGVIEAPLADGCTCNPAVMRQHQNHTPHTLSPIMYIINALKKKKKRCYSPPLASALPGSARWYHLSTQTELSKAKKSKVRADISPQRESQAWSCHYFWCGIPGRDYFCKLPPTQKKKKKKRGCLCLVLFRESQIGRRVSEKEDSRGLVISVHPTGNERREEGICSFMARSHIVAARTVCVTEPRRVNSGAESPSCSFQIAFLYRTWRTQANQGIKSEGLSWNRFLVRIDTTSDKHDCVMVNTGGLIVLVYKSKFGEPLLIEKTLGDTLTFGSCLADVWHVFPTLLVATSARSMRAT